MACSTLQEFQDLIGDYLSGERGGRHPLLKKRVEDALQLARLIEVESRDETLTPAEEMAVLERTFDLLQNMGSWTPAHTGG